MPLCWLDKLLHRWGPDLQRNSDQDLTQGPLVPRFWCLVMNWQESRPESTHWVLVLVCLSGCRAVIGTTLGLGGCLTFQWMRWWCQLVRYELDTSGTAHRYKASGQRGKGAFAWLMLIKGNVMLCVIWYFLVVCMPWGLRQCVWIFSSGYQGHRDTVQNTAECFRHV